MSDNYIIHYINQLYIVLEELEVSTVASHQLTHLVPAVHLINTYYL